MMYAIGMFLNSGANLFLFMILLPIVCGGILWLFRKQYILQLAVALLSAGTNLVFALGLNFGGEFFQEIPFAPSGFSYSLRVYGFSARFILLAAGIFLLISLYSVINLKGTKSSGLFLFYLYLSFAMVNGALLSDSLSVMLLFWEGLLAPLFCMLLLGKKANPATAYKALSVEGVAALLLMLGIIIVSHEAGTAAISKIDSIPASGAGLFGLITLLLGALGKAGSMPFHSWTMNASDDAPAAFMAAIPGALEKILGVYFALIIVYKMHAFVPGSIMSTALMALGTVTLLCGAAMALIQTDLKRFLAWIAVSQTGFMVLGTGSGTVKGILAVLFLLLNYGLFQTGLYMISGLIENKTGTADLRELGGLFKKMPLAAVCFIIFGLSAVGFPGLSGYLGTEILLDAAAASGIPFLIGACLGMILSAAAFLKIIRSLFWGSTRLPVSTPADILARASVSAGVLARAGVSTDAHTGTPADEPASASAMLIPTGILAFLCVLSGFLSKPLLDLFLSSDAIGAIDKNGSGLEILIWPEFGIFTAVIFALLILAACDHLYGAKKSGSALHAADHILNTPVIRSVYALAQKGRLDPYNWLMAAVGGFSDLCTGIEHGISWFYDKAVPGVTEKAAEVLHRFDNGSLPRYLSLAVCGAALLTVIFLIVLL